MNLYKVKIFWNKDETDNYKNILDDLPCCIRNKRKYQYIIFENKKRCWTQYDDLLACDISYFIAHIENFDITKMFEINIEFTS
jgi:hypothetical protein